jgi:hypothetical protein
MAVEKPGDVSKALPELGYYQAELHSLQEASARPTVRPASPSPWPGPTVRPEHPGPVWVVGRDPVSRQGHQP